MEALTCRKMESDGQLFGVDREGPHMILCIISHIPGACVSSSLQNLIIWHTGMRDDFPQQHAVLTNPYFLSLCPLIQLTNQYLNSTPT